MKTAFTRIADAIVAALQADPPVSTHIERGRDSQIPAEWDDAIDIQFDGAEPHPGAIAGAPVDWMTRISVDCYARGTTADGGAAVDALLSAAYARLAQDATLGGVVDDIGTPQIAAERDSLGQKTGWVRLLYSVQHRTTNSTLD